jgi:hypothetical protein
LESPIVLHDECKKTMWIKEIVINSNGLDVVLIITSTLIELWKMLLFTDKTKQEREE